MKQRLRDRFLDRPALYGAFKRLIGASRHMQVFFDDHVRPQPGQRILDIGCGTGDAAFYLPDVDYVGIDLNAAYIDAANRRKLPNAHFLAARVEDLPVLD